MSCKAPSSHPQKTHLLHSQDRDFFVRQAMAARFPQVWATPQTQRLPGLTLPSMQLQTSALPTGSSFSVSMTPLEAQAQSLQLILMLSLILLSVHGLQPYHQTLGQGCLRRERRPRRIIFLPSFPLFLISSFPPGSNRQPEHEAVSANGAGPDALFFFPAFLTFSFLHSPFSRGRPEHEAVSTNSFGPGFSFCTFAITVAALNPALL